jgi:hypothetical protein
MLRVSLPFLYGRRHVGHPRSRHAGVPSWSATLVGVVLPTGGDEISDTLAGILLKEPNWTALPAWTPNTLLLNADSSNVGYAQGYLLFLRETTLMAQPFDARRLVLTGDAGPIAEDIRISPTTNASGVFSASENGVLAYQTETTATGSQLARIIHGITVTQTPGTRLGSYEILSPLGAGGMGEVCRADSRACGGFGKYNSISFGRYQDLHRVGQGMRSIRGGCMKLSHGDDCDQSVPSVAPATVLLLRPSSFADRLRRQQQVKGRSQHGEKRAVPRYARPGLQDAGARRGDGAGEPARLQPAGPVHNRRLELRPQSGVQPPDSDFIVT